jgi:hypothetical protein
MATPDKIESVTALVPDTLEVRLASGKSYRVSLKHALSSVFDSRPPDGGASDLHLLRPPQRFQVCKSVGSDFFRLALAAKRTVNLPIQDQLFGGTVWARARSAFFSLSSFKRSGISVSRVVRLVCSMPSTSSVTTATPLSTTV